MSKYIVVDIVFYGNSLNYDQGSGNYQELKKITKWDGRQYVLVSRYALRYSILHYGNKLFPNEWKLAGPNQLKKEAGGVVHLNNELFKDSKILEFPEFDLFGFMSAKRGRSEAAITRVSPVKISHAISMTPFNFDTQFLANLDVMKRAGGEGSNPFTSEEKKDFYVYNLVIDVNRIGILDEGGDQSRIDEQIRNERIKQLLETIFVLKREIKGRMEDLSPWLMIVGLYNDARYETYMDKIEISRSNIYKVITNERKIEKEDGTIMTEIEHQIIEKEAPKFTIDIDGNRQIINARFDDILNKVNEFLEHDTTASHNISQLYGYKRSSVEVEPEFVAEESETINSP